MDDDVTFLNMKPLRGKVCMITGATSGLGRATATQLSALGATVILVGRNMERCSEAARVIRMETENPQVEFFVCDLASFEEVRIMTQHFKKHFERLDVLVNNAAAIFPTRTLSDAGFEMTVSVNHLGPFLLTVRLLDSLRLSREPHIVTITCDAHRQADLDVDDLEFSERSYTARKAYAQSKLLNLLFSYQLERRLASSPIRVTAVNPGTVSTNLGLNAGWHGIMKRVRNATQGLSPMEASEAIVYAITSPALAERSSLYLEGKQVSRSSERSYDVDLAREVWAKGEELTGANETVILGAQIK